MHACAWIQVVALFILLCLYFLFAFDFHFLVLVPLNLKKFYKLCTNPRCQVAMATTFCMSNVCESLIWNLHHVTLLAPRILRWLLHFLKICAPLPIVIKTFFFLLWLSKHHV
jgi:hypothetical protein